MKRQPVIDDVLEDCELKGGSVFIVESNHVDGFPHVELYTRVNFSGRHPYEAIIKGILALKRTEGVLREKVPDCKVSTYIMLTNSPVKHWTELLNDPTFFTMYDHYFPYKEVTRNSEPAAATPRI
jgi:hypothetical protein